jgi:hypothetical protein
VPSGAGGRFIIKHINMAKNKSHKWLVRLLQVHESTRYVENEDDLPDEQVRDLAQDSEEVGLDYSRTLDGAEFPVEKLDPGYRPPWTVSRAIVEFAGGDPTYEHPVYRREDWRQEVMARNIINTGYWDWVVNRLEDEEDEQECEEKPCINEGE